MKRLSPRVVATPSNLPDPTDEQTAILDAVRSSRANISIRSLAGTGKTTMLELIQKTIPRATPVLYVCFNKRIAEEAKTKFPSTTQVKTLNGLGYGVWAKACSHKLNLNPKKIADQFRALVSSAPKNTQSVLWDCYWEVVSGVGLAKSLGYIPEGKFPTATRLISREDFHARLDSEADDLTKDFIDELLFQSIKSAYQGYIDFDDQIYMSALFGGSFPSFPVNFIDEVQDLNPVNHVMVRKFAKCRLIAVGDPYQSIYGFRGAVSSGMQKIEEEFEAEVMNLSKCFRCRQKIVENAQWRAPHFQWTKDGGYVETLKQLKISEIPDEAAIICRNNAPLFRTALNLLAHGRSVKVAGSEIGPRIVAMMKKLGDSDISKDQTLGAIDDWLAERLAKKSTTATDIADCMRVFAERGNTLGQAIAYAEHILAQAGKIQLLTGHKSKGLEFSNVFHLDPFLIHDDNDEQELNLRYVIQTRAKDTYYEIDSARIEWDK